MPKRDRSQYMREYRARKRQSAGAGLDAPVAPSRAAVAEALAEPAASPEAGGGPAVPEVPERFAATLRFLAGAPAPEDFDRMAFIQSWMLQLRNAVERDGPRLMAAPNDDPTLDFFLVEVALDTLARDCGYMLRELGPPRT